MRSINSTQLLRKLKKWELKTTQKNKCIGPMIDSAVKRSVTSLMKEQKKTQSQSLASGVTLILMKILVGMMIKTNMKISLLVKGQLIVTHYMEGTTPSQQCYATQTLSLAESTRALRKTHQILLLLW